MGSVSSVKDYPDVVLDPEGLHQRATLMLLLLELAFQGQFLLPDLDHLFLKLHRFDLVFDGVDVHLFRLDNYRQGLRALCSCLMATSSSSSRVRAEDLSSYVYRADSC